MYLPGRRVLKKANMDSCDTALKSAHLPKSHGTAKNDLGAKKP